MGKDRAAKATEGRMICWAPAGWSLRQQQQHQQQMKQQSMDGRAYCGKHALIGSERQDAVGSASATASTAAAAAAADTENDTDANSS